MQILGGVGTISSIVWLSVPFLDVSVRSEVSHGTGLQRHQLRCLSTASAEVSDARNQSRCSSPCSAVGRVPQFIRSRFLPVQSTLP